MAITTDFPTPPDVADAVTDTFASAVAVGSDVVDATADAVGRSVSAAVDVAEPAARNARSWICDHPVLTVAITATTTAVFTAVYVRRRARRGSEQSK